MISDVHTSHGNRLKIVAHFFWKIGAPEIWNSERVGHGLRHDYNHHIEIPTTTVPMMRTLCMFDKHSFSYSLAIWLFLMSLKPFKCSDWCDLKNKKFLPGPGFTNLNKSFTKIYDFKIGMLYKKS